MKKIEPHFKKAKCPYCGDAPIPHKLFYIESLISNTLDKHIQKVTRRAPRFLGSFADWLPIFVFRAFVFIKLARFSDDITKAKTFRSKVIWEEAKRRGIKMEQLILFGKPLDYYRARLNDGRTIYFESIPIPGEYLNMRDNWDDKFILKQELAKKSIPTPEYAKLPSSFKKVETIFNSLKKPVIIKPKVGSRGRHTTTNINTKVELVEAIRVARMLSPYLVMEEHLHGYVCRATVVDGVLCGFYRGQAPFIIGDGIQTITELINNKNKTRNERVEEVNISGEVEAYIARSGFVQSDVLPANKVLYLSHRVGRLFGGATKEMLDELHPSFIPILQDAAKLLGLAVVGFDVIVPNPEADAHSQRWGVIECNTLPFIDLHYYALEGKPKNIAGRIWDMWK